MTPGLKLLNLWCFLLVYVSGDKAPCSRPRISASSLTCSWEQPTAWHAHHSNQQPDMLIRVSNSATSSVGALRVTESLSNRSTLRLRKFSLNFYITCSPRWIWWNTENVKFVLLPQEKARQSIFLKRKHKSVNEMQEKWMCMSPLPSQDCHTQSTNTTLTFRETYLKTRKGTEPV